MLACQPAELVAVWEPYGSPPVYARERMAGVHVDSMTGLRELILASMLNMEDPGYGAEGQSSKSSVEILISKAKVPTRRGT